MPQDRVCPYCHTPVAPLAEECPRCGAGLPGAGPRYHVVRANRPNAGPGAPRPASQPTAAPLPAATDLPPGVTTINEMARVWYCKIGGQTVGPVLAEDIRTAFSKGRINGQASVGVQGYQAWYPIRSLPQFAHMITGVGPVPAPRGPAQAQPAPRIAAPPLAASPAPAHASGPAPASPPAHAVPMELGRPSSPQTDRDDETLVVAPLPPPGWLAVGDSTGQVTDPRLQSLSTEVGRLRKLVVTLAVLSGLLFVLSGILVALMATD